MVPLGKTRSQRVKRSTGGRRVPLQGRRRCRRGADAVCRPARERLEAVEERLDVVITNM